VTLKPNRTMRWFAPVVFLALGVGMMSSAYQNLIHGGFGQAWSMGVFAVFWIAFAFLVRTPYIRVDDSVIVFGPNLPGRRRFDRREVARIRSTYTPLTRRTVFLRSDGSTLWSTPGFFWGHDGLQSLADYLGVPFEGWGQRTLPG
jgi:hypothetical protein